MKSKIGKLIEAGKTQQALDKLSEVITSDADLKNQITLLYNRFSEYEKTKIGNLEDPSVLSIELNKINQSILLITGKLDTKIIPSVLEAKNESKNTNSKWLKIGAGLVAAIAILANLTTILGYFQPSEKSNIQIMRRDTIVNAIPNSSNSDSRPSTQKLSNNQNSNGRSITQPSKPPSEPIVKEKESLKLVKIRLVVDAEFSDGDIFVNDKEVFPNSNSTMTVKYLEVPFQPNLEIKIKTSKDVYTKKQSISESDFDNQKTIQILCSK